MPQQNIKCWQWGSLRMPSKFRANLNFTQIELDKLAEQFPEINSKERFGNVSQVMQYIIDKVIKKELTEPQVTDEIDIDAKIKRQQLLKITLQNWNLLKEFPSDFEQKIAIILLKKEMVQPQLEFGSQQTTEKGFDQFYSCFTCKHTHSTTEPHVCTLLTCNCGVRG